MPRVQTTVEENYIKEVVKLTGCKVRVVPAVETNWKGENYETIKIELKN
jgi:hypothetical protein